MKPDTKWKLQGLSVAFISMGVVLLIMIWSGIDIRWNLVPDWCCDGFSPEGMAHRMLDPNTNMPDIIAPNVSTEWAIIFSIIIGGPLVLAALMILTQSDMKFPVETLK